MRANSNRREFLRATALTGAGLALSNALRGASNKSVLVFTKSSGFEHDVVKRVGGSRAWSTTRSTRWGISTDSAPG